MAETGFGFAEFFFSGETFLAAEFDGFKCVLKGHKCIPNFDAIQSDKLGISLAYKK